MRNKCLPIYLDHELYQRLEQRALAEERDPLQQVRWLLRQALAQPSQAEQPRVLELTTAGSRPDEAA